LNTTNFEQSIIDNLELDKVAQPSLQLSPEGRESELQLEDNEKVLSFLQEKNDATCKKGSCEKSDIITKTGSMIGEKAPDFI